MAICKNCGVDLGEGNEKCPLCEPQETRPGRVASAADLFRLSKIDNTRHLYEITMLLLVSGVIITLAIDLVFGRGMNWSLVTTTSAGYLLVFISAIYLLRKRPFLVIAATTAATMVFLWLVDLLSGNTGWSRTIACPLALAAGVLTAGVLFLNSLSRYRGLNLLATILIALAMFTLITEYLTDRLIRDAYSPQWSVVTAASLAIIAMFFIFIHYRMKRGRSLGRLFHI
ncbi:MAG: DUF6320 domain-containing protein [Bacteroidales bacterium]|jgi:hypothetical protein|nr:DUF6320 domain-containing protein [Bacteroidales bacterium]